MKKVLSLFLVLALLPIYSSAYAKGDDTYFENVFLYLVSKIGEDSYKDVTTYLNSIGYKHTYHEYGIEKARSVGVPCAYGEITIGFYPSKKNSGANQLMSSVLYEYNDKWVEASDSYHTNDVAYRGRGVSGSTVTFSSLQKLISFYNKEFSGNVKAAASSVATPKKNAYSTENVEAHVRSTANSTIRTFWNVTLESVSINPDASSTAPDAHTAILRLKWDVMNGEDQTRRMLEMYSNDLAVSVWKYNEKDTITTLWLFWTVPYHSSKVYAAKFEYAIKDQGALLLQRLGLLYGRI